MLLNLICAIEGAPSTSFPFFSCGQFYLENACLRATYNKAIVGRPVAHVFFFGLLACSALGPGSHNKPNNGFGPFCCVKRVNSLIS